MNRDKARIAVYALAGFYLLYLAWQMYGGLAEAGSDKPLMIGFIIFFVIVGAGLAGWGLYSSWKRLGNPADEKQQPESEEKSKKEENKE